MGPHWIYLKATGYSGLESLDPTGVLFPRVYSLLYEVILIRICLYPFIKYSPFTVVQLK